MALSLASIVGRIANAWRTAPYSGPVTPMRSGAILPAEWFGPADLDAALDAAGVQHEGNYLSPFDAIRLSTVWACGNVIAKAIASSDWQVFQQAPDGSRSPRSQSTVYRLLNVRPNPLTTPAAWREAMILQAAFFGSAFAEIERDGMGRPAALWVIPPGQAQLVYQGGGNAIVRVTGVAGGTVDLDYADVYHLRGPGLDSLDGADVMMTAMRAMVQSSMAERFGTSFYRNGIQFGGIFTSDAPVGVEEKAELRKAINAKHGGPDRAFNFGIMDNGLKFTPFPINPENAQFIETRKFLVIEVCRYFGVPPHKVQHLDQATFSNIEEQNIEFSRDCLTPWCERLRQEADFKLLVGSIGYRSRIDLDWLSEGNAATRATADAQLANNGLMSRNEIRAKRGQNPIGPDGDRFTVQAQMVDLDKLGQDAAPAPTPATPPTPANDQAPTRQAAAHERGQPIMAAVGRHLMRQDAAVGIAEGRAEDAAEFVALVEAQQAELAEALVEDLAAAAEMAGLELDLRAEARRIMENDMRLIGYAKAEGDVSGWCDLQLRAAQIAEEMMG